MSLASSHPSSSSTSSDSSLPEGSFPDNESFNGMPAEEEILSNGDDDTSTDESAARGKRRRKNFVAVPLDIRYISQREDAFPLPSKDVVDDYVWAPFPNEKLQTMTDYTLACQKACRKIWDNSETKSDMGSSLFHGICSYHAWNAWHRNNRDKFKKYEKNRKRMGSDFEQYKCSPWLPMIPVLRQKMMEKWTTKYKEHNVVKYWYKQWNTTAHTRVEQNQFNLLRGGLPAHNNNAEGRNNGDKVFLDYRKSLTTTFVHQLALMLNDRSNNDLKFCDKLHHAVHCYSHYK